MLYIGDESNGSSFVLRSRLCFVFYLYCRFFFFYPFRSFLHPSIIFFVPLSLLILSCLCLFLSLCHNFMCLCCYFVAFHGKFMSHYSFFVSILWTQRNYKLASFCPCVSSFKSFCCFLPSSTVFREPLALQ